MSEFHVGDQVELRPRSMYHQVLPTGKKVLLKARRGKRLTISEMDGDVVYWNEDGLRYRAHTQDFWKS